MQINNSGIERKVFIPEKCVICLTKFNGDERYQCLLLKCGHVFEEHCIKPWLQLHSTCPTCKCKNISPISAKQILKRIAIESFGVFNIFISIIVYRFGPQPLQFSANYLIGRPSLEYINSIKRDFYQIHGRSLLETPEERIHQIKVMTAIALIVISARIAYIFVSFIKHNNNKENQPTTVQLLNGKIE